MAKNTTKINQNDFSETCSSIVSGVISFFVMLLVTVFPLIYHNSYFDILETKYKCYYLCVLGMLVIVLVLAVVMLIIDLIEFRGSHAVVLFSRLKPLNWKTTFHAVDVAVLVFWAVAGISTLQSEYLFESFWGNEGRFSGLFLLTLYVAVYFVISRFWEMKNWLLEVFLVSGMVLCIIGITDYFQMDVLSFRGRIKPEQSTIFTSTLGNINTYTAYVALIMGLSATMFATEKNKVQAAWYYICMVISFFAIIMGCSDNAYLAIGAMFALLPLLLFGKRTGIWRYMVMLASFFTVIQGIDWINQCYGDIVIGLDSLFRVMTNFGGLLYVVVLLWVVVAVLLLVYRKRGAGTEEIGPILVRMWIVILGIAALVVCAMMYDANVSGNADRYGVLANYLVFNDSWGTNRGYIWRRSLELYQDFPLKHKLFGHGPDTFGILTNNTIKFDMINTTGQFFDNAHNEYLQYLLTIGLIGLASYVVFLFLAVIRLFKNAWKNPYIIGCGIAVLCYGIQALVNLNLPIATPMMWLLLSVGMAGCKGRR